MCIQCRRSSKFSSPSRIFAECDHDNISFELAQLSWVNVVSYSSMANVSCNKFVSICQSSTKVCFTFALKEYEIGTAHNIDSVESKVVYFFRNIQKYGSCHVRLSMNSNARKLFLVVEHEIVMIFVGLTFRRVRLLRSLKGWYRMRIARSDA